MPYVARAYARVDSPLATRTAPPLPDKHRAEAAQASGRRGVVEEPVQPVFTSET